MPVGSQRILIVDDEDPLRASIADFLDAKGYEVFEASDLRRAQASFRLYKPDAVLLDFIYRTVSRSTSSRD